MLTSDTVMAYFDKEKHTELTTDASPWGLSAILSQHTPSQEGIQCEIVNHCSDMDRTFMRVKLE